MAKGVSVSPGAAKVKGNFRRCGCGGNFSLCGVNVHVLPAGPIQTNAYLLTSRPAGGAVLIDAPEGVWAKVDPVLRAGTPVYEYSPNTWGPGQVSAITPLGGWSDPVLANGTGRP